MLQTMDLFEVIIYNQKIIIFCNNILFNVNILGTIKIKIFNNSYLISNKQEKNNKNCLVMRD